MLNFNFLNNLKHWGEALHIIENKMPHKLTDFRQSLQENNMEASIWLVEELKKYLEELKADWDNADDPIMEQDKKKGQYKKFLQNKLNKKWSK